MLLSYWVGTAVLNVREFPSASSRVLYQLKAGQELKGIPHGSEWLELGPNTSGYVARKLLVERKSLPQHGLLPMRVRVDQAEIHSGPGQQYPVLGLYFKHHKLEVEGLQGSWFRVGPDQYIREGELEAFQGKDSTQTM
ncbi:MAG: SH3 domain-containing protein [Proteobacteria bacterium]|nr:SH3 domain-containing protein [Pseudomonadota bacterium]